MSTLCDCGFEVPVPLIECVICRVFLPVQLGGSSIGVLASGIAPETVKILLALCILCFAVYKTFFKAMSRLEKEGETSSQTEATLQSNDVIMQQSEMLLDGGVEKQKYVAVSRFENEAISINSNLSSVGGRFVSVPFSEQDEYDTVAEQSCDKSFTAYAAEKGVVYPIKIFYFLITLWVINALLLTGMDFYDHCDWQHLLLLFITLPILFCFMLMGMKYVSRYHLLNSPLNQAL